MPERLDARVAVAHKACEILVVLVVVLELRVFRRGVEVHERGEQLRLVCVREGARRLRLQVVEQAICLRVVHDLGVAAQSVAIGDHLLLLLGAESKARRVLGDELLEVVIITD